MVSEGGASGARTVLDGTATGHTQQSAAHWTLEVLQPFSQHRARHARVDACVRLGSGPCRHRERPKAGARVRFPRVRGQSERGNPLGQDRKSTRLNSSHGYISYAVFCLKKKKKKKHL